VTEFSAVPAYNPKLKIRIYRIIVAFSIFWVVSAAFKVAFATWLGLLIGMVAKIALSFVMVGIFLIVLWL